ncbi:restriction endonuclease [Flavobacterium lindanitolerans]|uniref:restriction endonuclease n=1 Tax=Flavobacterium lindanitolerans TaxID=428988 RepID=UPI0027BAD257|nr:restriction endonuclease [Flavobacterium lindanitolerans]
MGNGSSELDWEEYEAITKYIYEVLGVQYGIKVKGYGRDNWVVGKSGVKHQVDVLTEQSGNKGVQLTAIECKFLKKKVTKDTVMKLRSVMDDADLSAGIIVSKEGFTRDTLTYAEHVGIKLVELRESAKETVNIGVVEFRINSTLTSPNITSVDLGSISITDQREIFGVRCGYCGSIRTPEGREIPLNKYFKAFYDELYRQNKFLKTITVDCATIKGKLVKMYGDREPKIDKVSITGFLSQTDESTTRSFQLVDQVYMIMKEIFEKEGYKLLRSGVIMKDKDNL